MSGDAEEGEDLGEASALRYGVPLKEDRPLVWSRQVAHTCLPPLLQPQVEQQTPERGQPRGPGRELKHLGGAEMEELVRPLPWGPAGRRRPPTPSRSSLSLPREAAQVSLSPRSSGTAASYGLEEGTHSTGAP